MKDITLRQVATNGINLRIAEAGDGPLVVLLHGFPESWYSWRHQLPFLAAAGCHAVAPDMRGYGASDKPAAVEVYDQVSISSDVAGLIDALGYDEAVVVGHDWGAPAAWHTAWLHPDKVRGVAGLSVPWRGRGRVPPLDGLKMLYEGRFFYMLYFQTPGVAEAELESDVRRFLRIFLHGASGEAPARAFSSEKAPDAKLLDGMTEPTNLPSWLSEADLDYYAGEFEIGGFAGPLNWYRNLNRTWEMTGEQTSSVIERPALFVAGKKDPVLTFVPNQIEAMKENLSDLRDVVLLEGCGHWTQQERPDEVNEALLSFIRGL